MSTLKIKKTWGIALLLTLTMYAQIITAEPKSAAKWDNLSSSEIPTIITAKAMNLNSNTKNFTYTGGVNLVKGDLTMTAEKLSGKYNDEQGIEALTASDRVVITKGSTIRARSNKAVYDKKSETMLLTDNPEVTQEDSILTADTVRIFLRENKSLAEGNVRVKLIPKK